MAQFVSQLLQPVAMAWVVLIGIGVWQVWKRQYHWASINGAMALTLFVFGSTPLSVYLLSTLEKPYLGRSLENLPQADVVIVLGGMVSDGKHEPAGLNFSDSSDRIIAGLELVRRGKGRNLIVGGGSFGPDHYLRTEFSVLKPWIERWNLTEVPIRHVGICANTHDEALRTAALMKEEDWEIAILVTSAWHMRRAEGVFRSVGVAVTPVGCDFSEAHYLGGQALNYTFLPQAGRLNSLRLFLHEHLGWAYYWMRGWIHADKAQ